MDNIIYDVIIIGGGPAGSSAAIYYATCDAAFYKDKIVAVIGSNQEAFEEAFVLTKFAQKIYLLTKENIKSKIDNFEVLMENPKVEIITYTIISDILGKDRVESIKYLNKTK